MAALLLAPAIAHAQEKPAAPAARPFALTIENIMRGPELTGTPPDSVRWSLDSRRVYFRWKEPGEPRRKDPDWFVVERDGSGRPRRLTEDEAKDSVPPGPGGGDLTRDRRRVVYAAEGDLFLMEAGVAGRRRLTETEEGESSPRWTRDEKHITFERGGNLYLMALDGSEPLRQLTDIRSTPPASDPPEPKGVAKIAQEQEKALFGVVREQEAKRDEERAKRKVEEEKRRKPFVLNSRQSVSGLQLTPDGALVLARVSERPEGAPAKRGVVPSFVNESGYVTAPPARPNVGEPQGKTRLVLLDVKTGKATWVTPPDALKDRELSFLQARFHESTDGPVKLAVLALAEDYHDRWVFTVDTATGKAAIADAAHDTAWIGGPGWADFGWMPDGERLWVVSEETTGYAHLGVVPASGAQPRGMLTAGKFEVFGPELSAKKDAWYFTSSEVDPGERHFYRMALAGGERVRLTAMPGNNEATLSPDEKTLAVIHSYTNRPPELYVQDNKPGATPRRVTLSPAPEFFGYAWRDVPLVTITDRDGFPVRARLFTPAPGAAAANGAAVIFAHGAGYLQNAHRGWSSYQREYMFHHFLAERGYTVLDVDYRGSAGYGRDSRTAVYKSMGGGKDLDDLVDAARWLTATQGIDPKRIGVYGGSYGGLLTLMALFKEGDTFACGAALRPVTDFSRYNHGYTARILGLPQDDFEAYKRSSPIYFAEGLKGGLLICHGMQDSNVFFQDTVRLAQKLIELGKDDWEVAIYPVEDHGFTEPSSWADEYKRIFRLFEKHLNPRNPKAG